MDSSTAKEQILKRIRKALLEKHDNPYPKLEELPLYPELQQDPVVEFAEQFTAAAGQFVFCEDKLQFIENLLLLAEKKTWRKIYCWEKPLQDILNEFEYPFYETDKDFEQAEIGLTLCEALVARNGNIVVSNSTSAGRRLSIYPHAHIVLAYTSQLTVDIKDALAMLKSKYGENVPSMISFITGPSRTADIEKTLVMGAHGPKELYVFLLEG